MINYYFNLADETGFPIYIETESKVHVRFYRNHHFELIDQAAVADELTIYFMVRQPQKKMQS